MRLLQLTHRKKVWKSHELHKLEKYRQTPKYCCEDSVKLKYLELENTRMATEVQFLKEQLIEKTTLS